MFSFVVLQEFKRYGYGDYADEKLFSQLFKWS
jgi:hypothetical protein